MLFNLGLPADAAASHRHEFSSQHGPEMNSDALGSQQSYLQPLHYLHEKLLAFTGTGAPPQSQQDDKETARPTIAASSAAETAHLDDNSIDTESRHPSASRKKTVYQLSHPVAKPRRGLRRSPMVLQLRQVEGNRRAAPVLELFKRRSLSRSATRSHSKKSNSHKANSKADGKSEGLVFVTCNSYDESEGTEDASEDEEVDRREVVASIAHTNCTGATPQAVLKVGEEQWMVSAMSNGGYEFSYSDERGKVNKARWVPKPTAERRPILKAQSPALRPPEKQFRFALLNPTGRRHPIVGSMDCHAIEVRDQFVVPDTPATTPNPSSPIALATPEQHCQGSYFSDVQSAANGIVTTSEHTRLLMLVTGVWVAITEGWTNYGYFSNESADYLASQPSISPSKLRPASPPRASYQESRSETPRSFASSFSHVFTGRRHRHTINVGSIPTADDVSVMEGPGHRRNSGFSLGPSHAFYESNRTTPAVSSENVVWNDSRHPSPSRAGLGIDVPGNSGFSPSIPEEPTTPSSSGLHDFLGRLHLGSKPEGRPSSDASEGRSSGLGHRNVDSTPGTGQQKKLEERGKRTRRLLGFRRSKDPG